jgi:hypothetical protein
VSPSPSAGRRGTGSWSPIAIREILLRERYRGVYVHGVKDTIERGGKRIAVAADPKDSLPVELPEWRIVDEVTWCAVQSELETRAHAYPDRGGPKPKYPLTASPVRDLRRSHRGDEHEDWRGAGRRVRLLLPQNVATRSARSPSTSPSTR